jgi:hypothetical protein
LQHRLRHGSQEIAIAALCSSSTSAILSSVIGSSVGLGWVMQRHLSRPSR